MAFLNLFISLFVSITFKFLPIYGQKTCKSSNCSIYGPQIKFPFLLKGQQDEICGYPGFNLTCSSQGQVAIDLPFSGRFFVREINYDIQKINLYDPNNCLPGRILELNLSGSPFVGDGNSNYSFLNCPVKDPTSYWIFNVTCLSNSTNAVMVVNAQYAGMYIYQDCVKMATVYVPYMRNGMNDMRLRWNRPQCESCEIYGGVCGVRSVGSEDVACFYPKQGKRILRIMLMAIIIPIFSFFSCVVFLKYYKNRGSQDTNNSIHISLGSLTTLLASPITRGGLDDSTIQSYPEIMLGETSHIPGLNDNNCPICLSEFLAKETVRFIPECTHCFHSNCIDEWLRLNSSCPVCRSSPTHVDSPSINV